MKSLHGNRLDFITFVILGTAALSGCQREANVSDDDLIANEPAIGMENTFIPPPASTALKTSAAPPNAVLAFSDATQGERRHREDEMVWWPFDEGRGREVFDLKKNPRHRGIFCGEGAWSPGKVGSSALKLDGDSAYVALPTPELVSLSDQISIAAWINAKDTNAQRNIFVQEDLTPGVNSELFLRLWGNQYQVGLWHGSDNLVSFDVPEEDKGVWVHLAGVYDGKRWLLYRNGELAVARMIDAKKQGPMKFSGPWTIGGSQRPNERRYFMGQIDELRLYNRALTSEEVRTLAEQSQSVDPAGAKPPAIAEKH